MKGNNPKFIDAIALAMEFFPESVPFIGPSVGFQWDAFLGAMKMAHYEADYSCYPFRNLADPDRGLAAKGGLNGTDAAVYSRLLAHVELCAKGRVIVVPDALGLEGWSDEECLPFVCDSQSIREQIDRQSCFATSRDTIIVFESGEAILVDHDERVHWARSRINEVWRNGCE